MFIFCLTEHKYWEMNAAHSSPNVFIDALGSLWNQAKAGPLRQAGNTLHRNSHTLHRTCDCTDRKNRRTWQRVVWKSRGEDHSPEYAVPGEWKACPVVPERRRQTLFAVRGGLERRVHGWYWSGEILSSVGHILVSWRGRSLVPVWFSPHPTPNDTDGTAGSARRPFSRMVFRGVRRW